MKVVFRADASLQIGTGHVMRCLTLAQGLAARGHECSFLVRKQPGDLIEHIRNGGFAVYEMTPHVRETELDNSRTPYSAWLGCTPEADAMACRGVILEINPEWIVVDHYSLDSNWTASLNTDARVLVIDDLANRSHNCDLLVDQTLGRDPADYSGLVPNHCKFLCGATFSLLRPEFAKSRADSLSRRKNQEIKQVLISLGGVDIDNVTGQVLRALASTDLPYECHFVVVLGSSSPWVKDIQGLLEGFPDSELRVNVKDMAALMAESDLAIGAAGSSSWERCCLGLPTIMIVLADNQRKVAFELEQYGAAVLIKDLESVQAELRGLIDKLTNSPTFQKTLSKNASEVTDGKGCSKVIEAMEAFTEGH